MDPNLRIAGFALTFALCNVAGCGSDVPERTDPTKVVREEPRPPRGGALLVVMHGGQDDMHIVLFTRGGTPVCELPRDTRCAIPLAPGATQLYARWDDEMVDRFDVEAAPGLTYYATMAWAHAFIDRKLTRESDTWRHLDEYLQASEDVSGSVDVPRLRTELGDWEALVRAADARMEHYEADDREAHTLHADDGV